MPPSRVLESLLIVDAGGDGDSQHMWPRAPEGRGRLSPVFAVLPSAWGLSPEGSRNPSAHFFSTLVPGLGQGTCWRLGVPVAAQAWPRV